MTDAVDGATAALPIALGMGDRAEAAPAKVNLSLRVTGRREDGYHLLDSLVAFADIGDVVALADDGENVESVRAAPAPEVSGAFADALRATLDAGGGLSILEAQALLARHDPRVAAARLALRKDLPIAAGVGGGSADAAAALRLLNRVFALGLPAERLAAMAVTLGADAPACVHSAPLRMRGIGEDITRLSRWPDLPVLLVNPGAPASTPEVFKRHRALGAPFSPPDPAPPETDDLEEALAYLDATGNDLAAAAGAVQPAIADALFLAGRCEGVRLTRMSGSGATVFALFHDIHQAAAAQAAVAAARPGWWARGGVLRGC